MKFFTKRTCFSKKLRALLVEQIVIVGIGKSSGLVVQGCNSVKLYWLKYRLVDQGQHMLNMGHRVLY